MGGRYVLYRLASLWVKRVCCNFLITFLRCAANIYIYGCGGDNRSLYSLGGSLNIYISIYSRYAGNSEAVVRPSLSRAFSTG